MKLVVKGFNEIPGLLYSPEKKSNLDVIFMSAFHNAANHLLEQVVSNPTDETSKRILQSFVALKRLYTVLADELEEIASILEVVEARLEDG